MRSSGILIILFALLMVCSLSAQWISPGDLSKGHKDLENINNCTLCHVIGGKIQAERCLTCHSKLKHEMEEQRGYHYLYKDRVCTECHKEHRGRDFPLIQLDKDNFGEEHAKLGFKLEGRHAKLQCEECHKAPDTYRGLDKNCLACHDDTFHGRLDKDCTKCHSFEAFKPSTFKHKEKDMAAQLAHLNTECNDCHVNGQFKNQSQECLACHKDEHKGQVSQKCEDCHKPNHRSFDEASLAFDHNKKTDFKLEAKHALLTCEECHRDGLYDLKHKQCTDCHQDEHKGEFDEDCNVCHEQSGFEHSIFKHEKPFYELQGAHKTLLCDECHTAQHYKNTPKNCVPCHGDAHKGRMSTDDCSQCHTQNAFVPSTFKHEKPHFGLTGAHQRTACTECHQERNFAPQDSTCNSCHHEEHKGQLALNCQECHKTDQFKPSTFKHKPEDFQAQGKHGQLKCEECHGSGLFKFPSTNCTTCHSDVHLGQLGDNCTQCHTYSDWTTIVYDHNQTEFVLKGQHRTLTCEQCHQNGVFSGTGMECYDCHQDPHRKSFGVNCEQCHTEDNWLVIHYNHELSGYALVGAHSQLNCNECHTNLRTTHLPDYCYGCHKADYGGAVEPNHKAAKFGTDCEECHNQNDVSWQQGYWQEHEAIFALRTSSGGHHDHFTCSECHPTNTNYKQYNCLACHLREETDAAHVDVRRYRYQNSKCLKCHPIGEVEE